MNVLFLTIDALTYTRLGVGGASPSPSPAMDALIGSGISLSRSFAAGCPTMFASPAIFTSRLPLDDGGYGLGIRGRGVSFPEVIRAAGYRTAGFATGFYHGRLFGYDRGFDEFHEFFALGLYQKVLRGLYIDYLIAKRNGGELLEAQCVQALEHGLAEFIPALQRYAAEKRTELDSGEVDVSPVLHDRDFQAIEEFLRVEAQRFSLDPTGYAARLLARGHEENAFDRLPAFGRGEALARAEARATAMLVEAGLPEQPTLGPSARYMVDQLQGWIGRRPADERWFAWAHLMDCHDLSFTSYDCDLPDEVLRQEVEAAAGLRDRLEQERPARLGNVLYDLSIRYVDTQVERLLDFLERTGRRGNTLIVLYSDHGGWRNGYPERAPGTNYMDFFDEMYHVPLAFVHPSLGARVIDGLSSSLDLAPTLLSLLGLPVPQGYRGEVVTAEKWAGRPHMFMEHLGSGPCDFDTKDLLVAVRSDTTKLVSRTPPLGSGRPGEIRDVYDLEADPLEQENRVGSSEIQPEAERLRDVLTARLTEIAADAGRAVSAVRVLTAPEPEIDLDQIIVRLIEMGHGPEAVPTLEAALGILLSNTVDGTGFELEDLCAQIERMGRGDVMGWLQEAVEFLNQNGRPATTG